MPASSEHFPNISSHNLHNLVKQVLRYHPPLTDGEAEVVKQLVRGQGAREGQHRDSVPDSLP